MQISTSRVNFTSSSVAQINYVEFVNKFRTTKKGVQDIVTILGVHTEDVFTKTKKKSPKSLWRLSLDKCLIKKSKQNQLALVKCVPLQRIKVNFERTLEWFQSVILNINNNGYNTEMRCDLRMALLKTKLWMKNERLYVFVLQQSNRVTPIKLERGQMLLNWFMSSISENKHLKTVLNPQDLKNLGIQYCTHLLAAGVLRQISDKDAPTENLFKPNLMYYWAHMEVPPSQPVTPGRLQSSAWPPDKDSNRIVNQENVTNGANVDNRFFNQNNSEDISDIGEAKIIIADLKRKLQELENQLERYKIHSEIDTLNKNLEKSFDNVPGYSLVKNRNDLINKEVQTLFGNEHKLLSKPVINFPENDQLKEHIKDHRSIELSSLDMSIKDSVNKLDKRSEKIENYCKLNKSRDCEKTLKKDSINENRQEKEEIQNQDPKNDIEKDSKTEQNFDKESNTSFVSTCSSTKITDTTSTYCETKKNYNKDIIEKLDSNVQELYVSIGKQMPSSEANQLPSELLQADISKDLDRNKEKSPVCSNENISTSKSPTVEVESSSIQDDVFVFPSDVKVQQSITQPVPEIKLDLPLHSPPPMPGRPPPPPPMPGTYVDIASDVNKSDLNQPTSSISVMGPPLPPPMPGMEPSSSLMTDMRPPPPPMQDMGPPQPPMPGIGPPPPHMPGIGPPPPPMPGMGPPPPPMPDMGPPPPPMPSMGPPPPPMPGIGPPPPPMPSMGPPPPPMPGMGPPPPPMPGMGPPPPPMPGMGPPPPPMQGMGPPPPPMPGITPMPPAMPGAPPPPGMPGLGPGPPPPPPTGPAPFPAPPVGGWTTQRSTLRKTPVKPAAPMKPLYWTRILAQPSIPTCHGELDSILKPLWLEIEETSLDNIDEFTDLFSRQVIKAPTKKKVEVKTKIQPVKILDSKRSQNVGILAQSLHVEFSEIENAVYNFDTSVVSLEALQQIYELRASEEELAMIKEHLKCKPDIPLDRPEAFLHDLSGIPNFAERISCFMFQTDFEDAINTTMHKLDNLKHTCEFLMTSESLKKLFAIILTLGNYMNGGNGQRGQADGFGLEILAKLKDVKSKQSNVTLLHFIVRTYMRCTGGALSATCVLPVPEPGDVTRAAAIDFADVASNLTNLGKQLDACKEKTKKVIESDAQSRNTSNEEPPGNMSKGNLEVFKDKMTTFLNAAEEKLKTENENLEECRNKFIATVKFYQYSSKCGKIEECEPKEFFSLWTSFCSDFKDIFKKEEQLAIKERLKETRKLQDERKSLTQPIKEGGLKARLQKLSSSRK
ncbi:protein cappuccino isoform X2 [Bombyx mori]|uniref:FH2 domain-containing protein n=1 Tax=Bombyx mori TaxID=7091 RepID=A0A8R2HR20_BOMMO|nr:protein cappuccino isoform X2 [Bombyx mori]